MNLFIVDRDPRRAARALCDRHVVKMTLETAQILCTVAHMNGHQPPYRPTHLHHPCVVWTAACYANWRWVIAHGLALADEYERRFAREHKSRAVIAWADEHGAGPARTRMRRQPFVQAMPEEFRHRDPVLAYRAFYMGAKARFATWRAPAEPPTWWTLPVSPVTRSRNSRP